MKLLLVVEHRFILLTDGRVWTTTGFSPAFWLRALDGFDEVCVAGRTTRVSQVPESGQPLENPAVKLAPIPMFSGALELVVRYPRIRSALSLAMKDCDAAVLQVPGALANVAHPLLLRKHLVYGVNAVGDPADVFSSGVGTAALRRLSRKWFVSEMKRQCKYASVAVYVTRTTLQQRYPPGLDTFAKTCSNVDLPEESFQSPRTQLSADPPFRLVTVVTLEQPYKGVDVLLGGAEAASRPERTSFVPRRDWRRPSALRSGAHGGGDRVSRSRALHRIAARPIRRSRGDKGV